MFCVSVVIIVNDNLSFDLTMNSLIKTFKTVKLPNSMLNNNAVSITAIRYHWNKDYKPGPYPKTEAERLAAAEKYGLPPSEYKPYSDKNGQGFGDYPELPLVSADSKDPYYPWDCPELKRNFNETLHVQFDLVREDRYDVSAKLRLPMWLQWAQFLGAMGGLYIIYHLFEKVKMFPGVTPRQYPNKGKKYYTFESE